MNLNIRKPIYNSKYKKYIDETDSYANLVKDTFIVDNSSSFCIITSSINKKIVYKPYHQKPFVILNNSI